MAVFPFAKNNFLVNLLESSDIPMLHELHKRCFSHPWDETTFDGFLSDSHFFGFAVKAVGQQHTMRGFILCRLVQDEAEIITIAVHPNFRRRNIGHLLMDAALRHLHHERANKLFLEVDESNIGAIKLYKSFGFIEIGRRANYYKSDHGRNDALILEKSIRKKIEIL